jgi:hypothetical protein
VYAAAIPTSVPGGRPCPLSEARLPIMDGLPKMKDLPKDGWLGRQPGGIMGSSGAAITSTPTAVWTWLRYRSLLPPGGEAEIGKGPVDLSPAERAQMILLRPGRKQG